MATDTALYKIFGADEELLYVGIGWNPFVRLENHVSRKDWWPAVEYVTVEWYGTRADALDAEICSIRGEHPVYNIQGIGGKRSRRPTPAQPNPIEPPTRFTRGPQ